VDIAGFSRSLVNDVSTGFKKWIKGRTTLDLPGKPCITHVQGIVIFMGFVVLLAVMFSYQASAIQVGPGAASYGGTTGGKPPDYSKWQNLTGTHQDSGYVNANGNAGTKAQEITDRNIASVEFKLTWTDEPGQTHLGRTYTNQPDELGVTVVTPWGQSQSLSAKNPVGGQGVVMVSFDIAQKKYDGTNGTGQWNYTIFAKACGPQTPPRIGLSYTDAGNAYSLDITWHYFTKPKK
jgi:hypothetical protein